MIIPLHITEIRSSYQNGPAVQPDLEIRATVPWGNYGNIPIYQWRAFVETDMGRKHDAVETVIDGNIAFDLETQTIKIRGDGISVSVPVKSTSGLEYLIGQLIKIHNHSNLVPPIQIIK